MPPRYGEYRSHFPVGAWMAGATIDIPNRNGTAGTTSISPGDAAGTTRLLTDQQYGYRATGITSPFFYFSVPAVQEDTQAVSAKLDDAGLYHVVGPWGRTGAVGTGIDAEYYQQASGFWTDANADAIAGPIVANYQDHPSLLAYNLEDDVSSSVTHADAVVKMAAAIQRADPYGRPATFVHLFPNNHNYWADYDCKLATTYIYPCGYYADGVTETAEGDFMSARVNASAPMVSGASQRDWVDYLRWWFSYVPTGVPIWVMLQTHDTTGTSTSGVRTPTDRELRKQFWIAVGEGVKGIFWFPFDNSTDIITKGLADATRASTMAVARELSQRLTPEIRQRLLGCTRVADLFTTSGGGKTYATPTSHNYPSAYKSTLQHKDGTRYVVICNHDTANATVTISSATLAGRLRNLETGTEIRVGGTWTLAALDGTIFEYIPDLGVPEVIPSFGRNTVQAWWDDHYANPDSGNYIAPGAIPTHAHEVVVAPGNLEAAITAMTEPTTFRLQAGNHPWMNEIVGKSHMHFIPDDALNPPVMRGIDIFGTSYALQYNNNGGTGFPTHLISLRTPGALAAWRNPATDIIFRGIHFQPDSEPIKYQYYAFPDGSWDHDHRWENVAIFMRNVRGVLIESCSASGYIEGTNDTDPTATHAPTTWNTTGTLMNTHPGIFCGNSGIENVVIRDCDITGPQTVSSRLHYATFFDGARGLVQHDIRTTGKFVAGAALLLCNGDYSFDQTLDGWVTRDDLRDAWCNVFSQWDIDGATYGQNFGFAVMGGNNLIVDNVIDVNTGTMTWFCQLACKAPLANLTAQGIYYTDWHNVLDGNDVTRGNCTTFVEHDVDQGWTGLSATHPFRSRIGLTTVTNNHVKGTVSNWIATKAGATATVDTPHVESGNTTG